MELLVLIILQLSNYSLTGSHVRRGLSAAPAQDRQAEFMDSETGHAPKHSTIN